MAPSSKNWCFTLNRRAEQDDDQWALVIATTAAAGALGDVGYLIFQVEQGGETAREHLQGYVQLSKRCTLATVKTNILKNGEVHLESARGSPQSNKDYCSKDEGRVAGPFEFGQINLMQQGRRTDIEDACALVLAEGMAAVAEQMPSTLVKYHRGLRVYQQLMERKAAATVRDPVSVAVLVGPTNVGKTWEAMNLDTPEHTYVLPIQNAGSLWFDGYEGQRTLVIDDFDVETIPYRTLLRLLDRYRIDVPHKGTYVAGKWHSVIITANHHPSTWYLGKPGVDFYEGGPLERRLELIYTTDSRPRSAGFETAFFLTFAPEDHLETDPRSVPEVAGNTEPQLRGSSHVATDDAAAPDDVMQEHGFERDLQDAQDQGDSDTQDFEAFLVDHGMTLREDEDYFSEDSVGF